MSKAVSLIFPSEAPSEEISLADQHLQSSGFSSDDREWLMRIFLRPDCFGDTGKGFKQGFLLRLEAQAPYLKSFASDRQIHLALLLSCLLDLGPIHSDTKPQHRFTITVNQRDIPDWANEYLACAKFQAKHLHWRKLVEIRDSGQYMFAFYDLVQFLFPEGIPLDQIVNLDLLDPIPRKNFSSHDFRNPEQLEFWLIWRFHNERADPHLQTLISYFSELPPEALGEKILGLLNAINHALSMAGLNALGDGWKLFADELCPFLDIVDRQKPETRQERSLLKSWWRLSTLIYSKYYGNLQADHQIDLKNRLIDSASKHLGIMRSELRDQPDTCDVDFYKVAYEALRSCATFPWKILKPLLLAFTEMSVPAVASDLRYWNEHDKEPVPSPYGQIPLWIGSTLYSDELRPELAQDEHLIALREEWAKFCLERLKTKKVDTKKQNKVSHPSNDLVEKRTPWRLCYIRALAELRVNPGGRAHKTLFWLSQNDPDEQVRKTAEKAHKQIRHLDRKKSNLDPGASPRRPLFAAFWWLRQAHLLTLGQEIDGPGAQATRDKELSRTKEKQSQQLGNSMSP